MRGGFGKGHLGVSKGQPVDIHNPTAQSFETLPFRYQFLIPGRYINAMGFQMAIFQGLERGVMGSPR